MILDGYKRDNQVLTPEPISPPRTRIAHINAGFKLLEKKVF